MNGQKPGIPMRNLAIFLVASVLLMFAWTYVENKSWPKARALTAQEHREVRDAGSQLTPSREDLPEEERKALSHDAALPSFLFYHYTTPEDQRPEPSMGEKEWKVVARPNDAAADVQTIALSADLPELGVKVTKIFT